MVKEIVVHCAEHIESDHPDLDVDSLIKSFKLYKGQGTPIAAFGVEGGYSWPALCKTEEVMHIHLIDRSNPHWHKRSGRRTSDIHLIYCQSYFHRNHYLFIDILKPAHDLALDNDTLQELGEAAEVFRSLSLEDLESNS